MKRLIILSVYLFGLLSFTIHKKQYNSLSTGATPYANCYGRNLSCKEYGCSEIRVTAPSNSDVIVTIKQYGRVKKHAYINSGATYSLSMPNGTYQTFFYYGKDWDPQKVMNSRSCSSLKGGFRKGESFSKDSPQALSNNILTYELVLQQNGNFETKPSNKDEAF